MAVTHIRLDGEWFVRKPPGKGDLSMPPRSYLITAVALAVLVAVSLPPTLGFSVIAWGWLFTVAAWILFVVGAFRVVHGLRGPRWIGAVLVLPGLVWVANNLRTMNPERSSVIGFLMSGVAAQLALLAAAAGALGLVETVSRPHAAFRVGYALLAVYAFVLGIGLVENLMGWSFTKNALYATSARVLRVAATFVEYGAVIAAAVLVTMRRDIEVWAGAVVCLIGIYMLYDTIRLLFVAAELRVFVAADPMFLVQPVLMLIGAAAVWRIGSVLNAQAVSERYAQS
jgi:hypothetical protein